MERNWSRKPGRLQGREFDSLTLRQHEARARAWLKGDRTQDARAARVWGYGEGAEGSNPSALHPDRMCGREV